ncbi:MAG: IS3 family transposase [Chloroflexota bacterium]|nr:IS3 family transposase [Chloroflexota bacterium]
MTQQAQTPSELSVEARCEALDVSVSGYYAWCGRDISSRQQADVQLGDEIERVFVASRRTYGSHRVWLALGKRGIRTARKRVERLMRQRELRSIRARQRRFGLTQSGQSACFEPNMLQQNFSAAHKNEKWVTDTTYIPTREGWLHLVSVMDLFSRQIVGWAMGEHHDADLAASALDIAIRRARPAAGLILHSDRGSEFANATFHDRAAEANIHLSISRTGNCYDNAAAESFFATVKLEATLEDIFSSRQQARMDLFDFIEVFYNRQRLHSGIDYACPVSRAA